MIPFWWSAAQTLALIVFCCAILHGMFRTIAWLSNRPTRPTWESLEKRCDEVEIRIKALGVSQSIGGQVWRCLECIAKAEVAGRGNVCDHVDEHGQRRIRPVQETAEFPCRACVGNQAPCFLHDQVEVTRFSDPKRSYIGGRPMRKKK